jgi:hypothetical protein
VWSHSHYEAYKCHGPYVKNWACCSASWHPSLLGHELRAAHYSYFWLLIFKDALNGLLEVDDYNAMSSKVIRDATLLAFVHILNISGA